MNRRLGKIVFRNHVSPSIKGHTIRVSIEVDDQYPLSGVQMLIRVIEVQQNTLFRDRLDHHAEGDATQLEEPVVLFLVKREPNSIPVYWFVRTLSIHKQLR